MTTDLCQVLARLVEPVVADHGAELVDVEVSGSRNSQLIRLLVHMDPAIPVNVCEAISREVGDLLDVEDPVPGRYRLEVTSPGLGRPLCSDADFRRAAGRPIKAVMRDGRTWQGKLLSWDTESLTVDLDGREAHQQRIERGQVAKATIIPQL
jgi:ribosome maturation factor RimP